PKRSRVNRARCENGFPASPQRELNGKGESLTVGKTGTRRRGMNIRLPFRLVCALALASILTALPTVPSLAHHGWSWTDEEIFELEGTITEIYVGNPHATLDVDVAGEIWRVELAPPSQTVCAGFSVEAARPACAERGPDGSQDPRLSFQAGSPALSAPDAETSPHRLRRSGGHGDVALLHSCERVLLQSRPATKDGADPSCRRKSAGAAR